MNKREPLTSQQPVRSTRGFVNYDVWILLVVIVFIAAVIVPNVLRAIRKQRLRRTEFTVLRDIGSAQRRFFDTHHRYLDTLPFSLPEGVHFLSLRGDTAGWSAAVTSDSFRSVTLACGVFEGPLSFSPNPVVQTPGRIACW